MKFYKNRYNRIHIEYSIIIDFLISATEFIEFVTVILG